MDPSSIAAPIVQEIGNQAVEGIKHQLGYLIYYNRNIGDFKKKVKELKTFRNDVQGQVDADEMNGQKILETVQKWLKEVEEIVKESEKFFDDEVKTNQRCSFPFRHDLKSRYEVSKKAKEKTEEVVALLSGGKFGGSVSSRPRPPTLASTLNIDWLVFQSRKSAFDGIMEALTDDNISMIGVYGMGGIGKTTLMKEVVVEACKLFRVIAMPTISQTVNVRNIQGEIADKLGLKFEEESESGRAGRLCERIINEKERTLIILDDVWKKVNLEAIGIPCGAASYKGCKILFTTRNQDVCRTMNSQRWFKIDVLSELEAWNLFKKIARETVELADVHPIAKQVVKECGGLPIAIVTVAAALNGRRNHVWSDALRQLKNSTPVGIEGMEADVYSKLELSYNFLENEVLKNFFLLCCLFPEDYNIRIEDLMRHCMGFRLFQGVHELDAARERTGSLVDHLKARCLLLHGDDEEEKSIRMHDVIRDFGLSIASKINRFLLVNINTELEKYSTNDSSNPDTSKISYKLPDGLDLSELKLLNLDYHSKESFSDNFFEEMKQLRVLNMFSMHIRALPSSVQSLMKLRTLFLQNCRLGDLSLIGNLKELEIVDFRGSTLAELPRELGQLTRLRLLDLTSCERLKIIPPGVISRFSRLECLYLINSFEDWEVDDQDIRRNASLAELKLLPCLRELKVQIPDIKIYAKDLHLGNLIAFQISIGSSFDEFDRFSYSKTLKLGEVQSIEGGVNMLLKRAECLILEKTELENVIYDLRREGFPNLKCLKVTSCKKSFSISKCKGLLQLQEIQISGCKMEEIVVTEKGEEEATNTIVFPRLHTLSLAWMDELVSFCSGNICFEFPSLKKLKIFKCPNMKTFVGSEIPSTEKLTKSSEEVWEEDINQGNPGVIARAQPFFSDKVLLPTLEELRIFGRGRLEMLWHRKHSAESFSKLRELSICLCNSLEVVLEHGEDSGENVVLPNLRSLELIQLRQLKSFYRGNLTLELPSLETVTIVDCPDMETFSSGIVITTKLNASGTGHRKKLWKGDLNNICKGDLSEREDMRAEEMLIARVTEFIFCCN